METKKVFMNGDDRDYLLDRLEAILHDNHCVEYIDGICNSFSKYITSNNRELKPFNLEAAKAGKPVCTRDGRRARIICFDKKCLDEQILIVLVDCSKEESIYFYTTDGKCIDDLSSSDLMMLTEKKEGQVNVYRLNFRDLVLVRSSDEDKWCAAEFSHKDGKWYAVFGGLCYEQCIPYNEQTSHLLGTCKSV